MSIEHAKELDKENGNTLCQDNIRLKMVNIGVAFKILEDIEHVLHRYRMSSGHIIWDLKMDLTCKTI